MGSLGQAPAADAQHCFSCRPLWHWSRESLPKALSKRSSGLSLVPFELLAGALGCPWCPSNSLPELWAAPGACRTPCWSSGLSLVPVELLSDGPVLSLFKGGHSYFTGTFKTDFLQGGPGKQSEMAMPLSLDLMAQEWCADGVVGGSSRSTHHRKNSRRDGRAGSRSEGGKCRLTCPRRRPQAPGHSRSWSGRGAGNAKQGCGVPPGRQMGRSVPYTDKWVCTSSWLFSAHWDLSILDHPRLEDPVTDNLMPATRYRDQYHVAH